MTSLCALLPGGEEHHLDHLAPLASILRIPLVVADLEIAQLAGHYYPDLNVLTASLLELPFFVLENFDMVLTCLPRPLLQPLFFVAEFELQKRLHTLWLPHGHSDKGRKVPFFEGLKDENALLVYGPAMERRLKEVLANPPPITAIGSFREAYYKHHAAFYDELLQKEIRPFLKRPRVYLYAPTWDDAEDSSSLDRGLDSLMNGLPEDVTLLLKLHPHSRKKELLKKVRHHEGVFLLECFPPVFPLLQLADAYIGDFSSIGYDFLSVDRPLILLMKEPRESALSLAAHTLPMDEAHRAFSLKDSPLHAARRQELYADTFGS